MVVQVAPLSVESSNLTYGDAVKALGHEAAFECSIGDSPLVYFDTVDAVGHFIELWDNSDVYKDLFMLVEDAAKGWDGKNPVRPLTF